MKLLALDAVAKIACRVWLNAVWPEGPEAQYAWRVVLTPQGNMIERTYQPLISDVERAARKSLLAPWRELMDIVPPTPIQAVYYLHAVDDNGREWRDG